MKYIIIMILTGGTGPLEYKTYDKKYAKYEACAVVAKGATEFHQQYGENMKNRKVTHVCLPTFALSAYIRNLDD